MPDFTYEALDKSGSPTTGTITARDSQDAAVRVRALGVFPTRITQGGKSDAAPARNGAAGAKAAGAPTALRRGKKVTRLLLLLFTRQIADLLDAGLPMDRVF